MTTPKLTWTKLEPKPDPIYGVPYSCSLHGISLIQRPNGTKELFLYGGEHNDFTPIGKDNSTWLCAENLRQWKRIDVSTSEEYSKVPPGRVSHAQAIYDNRYIYTFGGRSGRDTVEEIPTMKNIWVFDIETEKWEEVIADTLKGDPVPEIRSFHPMVCIGHYLYVFGGCGFNGRLNDLHRFDVITKKWYNLGSSHLLRGRGGSCMIPLNSGRSIAIMTGYANEETAEGHVYDIENGKWADKLLSSDELNDLRPRSVAVSAAFPSLGIAIIFGGEVNPSDPGYDASTGSFENDLVILDEKTGSMIDIIQGPTDNNSTKKWPPRRGWSSSSSIDDGNGNCEFYIYGGLTGEMENPQRLGDLWKLELRQ